MHKRTFVIAAAAAFAIAGFSLSAAAQYAAPGWRGDDGRNPLDDFFARMDRNNPNPNLNCNVYKRLNREGEIVWIRMECRALR